MGSNNQLRLIGYWWLPLALKCVGSMLQNPSPNPHVLGLGRMGELERYQEYCGVKHEQYSRNQSFHFLQLRTVPAQPCWEAAALRPPPRKTPPRILAGQSMGQTWCQEPCLSVMAPSWAGGGGCVLLAGVNSATWLLNKVHDEVGERISDRETGCFGYKTWITTA